tara:strand:- start:2083 stop:2283 length:201 start_codon:yes stop_codon:yes gene_type:complete
MNNMIKLTRQTGDPIYVNIDNVNFLTSKVELGADVTEVAFTGSDKQAVMVKETLAEVEEMYFQNEN